MFASVRVKFSPSGDLSVLYCIHLLWLVLIRLYCSVMLLCTYCVAYGVRCVAMRLLHLLCFGLYDAVAVSVGAVVERLFRGHRCRDEIQGAADEAIETVMNFRKLQLGACMSLQVLQ